MITQNKYLIIFSIFFIHLFFLNFPTINFEYVFFEAASQLENNKFLAMNNYFQNQANTFVFPFLIFISNSIFSLDYLTMSRFLSILCIIPLGISIIKFCKIISFKYTNYLILLILMNPFVFVMSHRGTPDFISAAIALISLPYLIDKNRGFISTIIFSLLLGLSISLKPTVGIILIIVNIFYYINCDYKFIKACKELFIINLLSLSPFITYSLFINFYFSFYLTNDYYYNSLKISSIYNYVNNFILYLGYTYLFVAPLRVSFLFQNVKEYKFKYSIIFVLPIIFFLGLYFPIPQLELNLSILSSVIGRKFENCIYFVSFSILLFDIYMNRKNYFNRNKFYLSVFLSIIIFFLIMSLFSPSQRYLICVMPLFIFLFYNNNNKLNIFFTLLLYLSFSIFLSVNQFLNGKISEMIVSDLKEKNIISISCPGVIEAHLGNKFTINNKNCNTNARYTVYYGSNDDSFLIKNIKFLFISKTLSVAYLKFSNCNYEWYASAFKECQLSNIE